MARKDLSTNVGDFTAHRKDDPRTTTAGTSLSPGERDGVYRALQSGGFRYPGQGIRAVLFAYRDSAEVRDAVARAADSLEAAA